MAIRHTVVSHPFTATLIRIKARQLCRRSDFSRSDYNDIRQDMLVYLLEKMHLFDPARGNVEAFVTTAIKSWVGMELRRRTRIKRSGDLHAVSLEGTIVENAGDSVPLVSILNTDDHERRLQRDGLTPTELLELQDAIHHGFNSLSPQEQALLLHVAEHGVASAARERNISRRQVDNAIARMRARFEDAGLGAG